MNTIWRTILLGILALAGLIFLIFGFFDVYTRHGEAIPAPDLKGKSITQAMAMLDELDLEYTILDSTYYPNKRAFEVYQQDPKVGSFVKEGRTIYLYITTDQPPKTRLPNLKDLSMRQAEVMLRSLGLRLGKVTYKEDIANVVLEMSINNIKMLAGGMVNKGSMIDLLVGEVPKKTTIDIPDLIGFTVADARLILADKSLTIGSITMEGSVTDMETALITKQNPEIGTEYDGTSVDIWISQTPIEMLNQPTDPVPMPTPEKPTDPPTDPNTTPDNIDDL
jgi:beta-lactam-binding protein with PASTA domain